MVSPFLRRRQGCISFLRFQGLVDIDTLLVIIFSDNRIRIADGQPQSNEGRDHHYGRPAQHHPHITKFPPRAWIMGRQFRGGHSVFFWQMAVSSARYQKH